MKCPSCGAPMGLEDAACPYCGEPNDLARQHQYDMARYRMEYERTQDEVLENTSLMQRHGSWLVILVVLLVALVVAIGLNAVAWDIGYSIREGNVERDMAEHAQTLDAYLEQGEYGKFAGYFNANDINMSSNRSYHAVKTAADAYAQILEDVAALNDPDEWAFKPDHVHDTCVYLAGSFNRIYMLEQQFSYDPEESFPRWTRAYVDDIRERTAVIGKTYFGLTDDDIRNIPNMSVYRLAQLIEEGIAS